MPTIVGTKGLAPAAMMMFFVVDTRVLPSASLTHRACAQRKDERAGDRQRRGGDVLGGFAAGAFTLRSPQ